MEEEVIITEECVEENPEENQEETNAIQKTEDTEQEKMSRMKKMNYYRRSMRK